MELIIRYGYPLLSVTTVLTLVILKWPALFGPSGDYFLLFALCEFVGALVLLLLLLVPQYRHHCFIPKNATVSKISIPFLLLYCSIVAIKLHALVNSTDP